ncbi:MAG TPA: class I SAM-dependent methyltransferase, partial [Tepidisphaeraceae bacterium]|nr:class I SAM-dependent methyltransferase [Tepidisphaeraceae bacterium]
MTTDAFGGISDVFEAMTDWPKRLANEQGFFRWLFDRVGAQRILDAACGTGHHAALFNSWQLRVEGADLSPAMVERCRSRFGQSETLRWAVRGFDQPMDQPGSFDVALCIGNS